MGLDGSEEVFFEAYKLVKEQFIAALSVYILESLHDYRCFVDM